MHIHKFDNKFYTIVCIRILKKKCIYNYLNNLAHSYENPEKLFLTKQVGNTFC